MDIPPGVITQRLISEFGYPATNAEEAAQNLQQCTPAVQKAFEQWWQGGGLDEQLTAEGYTLQRLINEYALGPIAAFLTMDWLIREPELAVQALAEGYDTIE